MILPLLLVVAPQIDVLRTGELGEAYAPGPEWVRLEPAEVQAHPDFAAFEDAFTAERSHSWKESPRALAYGVARELPQAWTLRALRAELLDLRARLHASESFQEGNGPLLRDRLTRELNRLVEHLSGAAAAGGLEVIVDWPDVKEAIDERFQPLRWTYRDDEGVYVTDTLFFEGLPTQVILRLDRPPEGLGGSQPLAYFATLEQAIELRAVCARVTAFFSVVVQLELDRTVQRLREIDRGWTNYLEHGYSQYPWESWANGWLTDFSWTRPPRSQWVLLHPELGFVLDTRRTRSAEAEPALLLHGIGHLRYFGAEREWFAGLSATASITGDSAYGLGLGPTVHFGHTRVASRVPHVSVSVLWHDFDDGGWDPVVAATLDLWRVVDGGTEAFHRARLIR